LRASTSSKTNGFGSCFFIKTTSFWYKKGFAKKRPGLSSKKKAPIYQIEISKE